MDIFWNVWFQKISISPPPPTEGICPMTPPPLQKFQFSFIHCFKFLGLWDPLLPGISNPFCGGSMDIFWNHTITHCPHSTIYREMGEGLPNKQNFPVWEARSMNFFSWPTHIYPGQNNYISISQGLVLELSLLFLSNKTSKQLYTTINLILTDTIWLQMWLIFIKEYWTIYFNFGHSSQDLVFQCQKSLLVLICVNNPQFVRTVAVKFD